MLDILFAFFISYFVLFVCWFLPKAGTQEFEDPTIKELLSIAVVAAVPASMVAFMF